MTTSQPPPVINVKRLRYASSYYNLQQRGKYLFNSENPNWGKWQKESYGGHVWYINANHPTFDPKKSPMNRRAKRRYFYNNNKRLCNKNRSRRKRHRVQPAQFAEFRVEPTTSFYFNNSNKTRYLQTPPINSYQSTSSSSLPAVSFSMNNSSNNNNQICINPRSVMNPFSTQTIPPSNVLYIFKHILYSRT